MNCATLRSGTSIAQQMLESSTTDATPAPAPTTLHDLMVLLEKNPPKHYRMLRSTAAVVAAKFFNLSLEAITLDRVAEMRGQFRRRLEAEKYTENSVRSYVNYVRILIRISRNLGWRPGQNLPQEWQRILPLARKRKCADIVHYLAQTTKSPKDVTINEMEEWLDVRLQEGLKYNGQRDKKNRFWRLLKDCGWHANLPISIVRVASYGIRLDQCPEPLKSEVTALLKWKTEPFAYKRLPGFQVRQVTAEVIEETFCRLLGFAVKIRGLSEINSLSQLIKEEIVADYVNWCVNERGVKGESLQKRLGVVDAALRQHPSFPSSDLGWLKDLVKSVPMEPESERRMRKTKKYLEYSVIETIPRKIRADRVLAAKDQPKEVTRLAMEELLIKWLINLAWRQRNIRECRIGGSRPNLFKGKIPSYVWIDKPSWVQVEERDNPEATFWQVHFVEHEFKTGTKRGKEIRTILPRPLIKPLEEFLAEFRPQLVSANDPGTLFVKDNGTALTEQNVSDWVADLTMRYGGKRVNPHLFRDIVAFAWLKEHPKDYLTLSKILWHANINYTIRVYGSQFDESSGVCAMEAWVEEREAKSK